MDLELEPLEEGKEDRRLLPPEERERMRARIRPVSAEALAVFDEQQRLEIKVFLVHLITLSEHAHHDMVDKQNKAEHREHLHKLHAMRQALFGKASAAVNKFVQLVDLSPMEPWLEWEVFLHTLHGDMHREYFETKNRSGDEAARDNPFLLRLDDDSEDEQMAPAQQGRITTQEIEKLIYHFDLEMLVKQLILARKVISGDIWVGDYDL